MREILVTTIALLAAAAGCSGSRSESTNDQPRFGVQVSALLNDPGHCVLYDIQLTEWNANTSTWDIPGASANLVAPNGNQSMFEYTDTLFCNPNPSSATDHMVTFTIHIYDNCVNGQPTQTSTQIHTASNVVFDDCPDSFFNPVTGMNEIIDKTVTSNFGVPDAAAGPGAFDVSVTANDLYLFCKRDIVTSPAGTVTHIAGAAMKEDAANPGKLYLGVDGLATTPGIAYFQFPASVLGFDSDLVRIINGAQVELMTEAYPIFASYRVAESFYAAQNAYSVRSGASDVGGQVYKPCDAIRNMAVFRNRETIVDSQGTPLRDEAWVGGIAFKPSTQDLVNDAIVFSVVQWSDDPNFDGKAIPQTSALDARGTDLQRMIYDMGNVGYQAIGASFDKGAQIKLLFKRGPTYFYANCGASKVRNNFGCARNAANQLDVKELN